METIVLTGGEPRSLRTADAPIPEPGPGEVRLAVRAAGVCGSDVGAWHGKTAYDFVETPRVLGHEYVGVVDAVGDDGTGFSVGDRVVERPLHACGVCTACRNGAEHVCENLQITGFHFDGAFAPYHVVPTDALHPVPDAIPDRRAAVTEPMAVAARATLARTDLRSGDDVLVLGAGPMGAFSALVADRSGAHVVVGGLERDRPRFEVLHDIGLETATLEDTTPAAVAAERADGSFDVLVDATGSTAALEGGMRAVRPGGEGVVIGIPSGRMGVETPSFVRSEQRVSGSYGARPADFERALEIIADLGDRLDRTLVDVDPADAPDAFQAFANGEIIKPVLDVAALRR